MSALSLGEQLAALERHARSANPVTAAWAVSVLAVDRSRPGTERLMDLAAFPNLTVRAGLALDEAFLSRDWRAWRRDERRAVMFRRWVARRPPDPDLAPALGLLLHRAQGPDPYVAPSLAAEVITRAAEDRELPADVRSAALKRYELLALRAGVGPVFESAVRLLRRGDEAELRLQAAYHLRAVVRQGATSQPPVRLTEAQIATLRGLLKAEPSQQVADLFRATIDEAAGSP